MNTTILELEGEQIAPYRSAYEAIPFAFEVRSRLEVQHVQGGLGGVALREVPLAAPYVKDYTAIDSELAEPSACLRAQQNTGGHWMAVMSLAGERAVGGAVVAMGSAAPLALDARRNIAVLWDLRVSPDCRRQGIGGELFARAAAWARRHECIQLAAETQNVNVAACRFYARQGCRLGAIHLHAYAACPQAAREVAMVWYLDL